MTPIVCNTPSYLTIINRIDAQYYNKLVNSNEQNNPKHHKKLNIESH